MDVAFQEQILRCITLSTEWLNRDSSGGAHTEVLRIDGEALARRLAPLADGPAARRRLEEQAARVAARFLLKRGKIRDFQMRLVGSRENVIPRTAVSYAFGPVGYTIHPSLEKVRIDVADAVRQIPYFGAGQREIQLAPDILESLARAARGQESSLHPGRTDPFLVRLGEDGRSQESVYEIAARDPYFQGRAAGWRELRDVQQTVRRHPLSTGMEERLRRFFDAPITVGWRDVLRYAKGSRHPDFGWQTARELVARCFDRWSGECFLLPEITYYAPALDGTPESLARMRASNREAAASLARVLEARLPRAARQLLGPGDAEQIAWDLLEFHHDYPVYRVEPYQGVISVSMARMVARSGVSLASVLAGVGLPEPRNRDVRLFLERPLAARRIVSELRPRDLRKTVAALEAALAHERQRSGGAPGGGFRRIDRTFYTFQERADHTAATLGRVERVLTLEDLWTPEHVRLLDELPELAEKLLVYFVLAYRYYVDTGFVVDLRPRNAGRDLFLYGIWGYLTENLLVVLWKDPGGVRRADVRFVDNRDQFKEFRRDQDRTSPVGLARTAVRLTNQVTEPSLRRSIGIFADQVRRAGQGEPERPASFVERVQRKGLDMLQAVAHDVVGQVFENGRVVVDDVVDDLFEGVRQVTRKLDDAGLLPEAGKDQ